MSSFILFLRIFFSLFISLYLPCLLVCLIFIIISFILISIYSVYYNINLFTQDLIQYIFLFSSIILTILVVKRVYDKVTSKLFAHYYSYVIYCQQLFALLYILYLINTLVIFLSVYIISCFTIFSFYCLDSFSISFSVNISLFSVFLTHLNLMLIDGSVLSDYFEDDSSFTSNVLLSKKASSYPSLTSSSLRSPALTPGYNPPFISRSFAALNIDTYFQFIYKPANLTKSVSLPDNFHFKFPEYYFDYSKKASSYPSLTSSSLRSPALTPGYNPPFISRSFAALNIDTYFQFIYKPANLTKSVSLPDNLHLKLPNYYLDYFYPRKTFSLEKLGSLQDLSKYSIVVPDDYDEETYVHPKLIKTRPFLTETTSLPNLNLSSDNSLSHSNSLNNLNSSSTINELISNNNLISNYRTNYASSVLRFLKTFASWTRKPTPLLLDYYSNTRSFSPCVHQGNWRLGCGSQDQGLTRDLAKGFGLISPKMESVFNITGHTYLKLLEQPKIIFKDNNYLSFPEYVQIVARIDQSYPKTNTVSSFTSIYHVPLPPNLNWALTGTYALRDPFTLWDDKPVHHDRNYQEIINYFIENWYRHPYTLITPLSAEIYNIKTCVCGAKNIPHRGSHFFYLTAPFPPSVCTSIINSLTKDFYIYTQRP